MHGSERTAERKGSAMTSGQDSDTMREKWVWAPRPALIVVSQSARSRRRVTTYVDPHLSGEMAYDETGTILEATPIIPIGVVEFRVHGVNGGTPEQNLGDPHPIRVAGNERAGIYRRRDELNSGPDRTVEAYNWSSMNSRKSIRAWWLLLFPFAASNFAGWLLPKGLSDDRRAITHFMVRVMALIVTFVAVVGMGLTTVDIIGVQCGGSEACRSSFWFGWLDWVVSWGPIEGLATRRAAIFSLVPLMALFGAWWAGRRSSRYEAYGAPSGSADTKPTGKKTIDDVRMDDVAFWQAPDSVFVQMWIHVSVAIAGLAGVMAVVFRQLAPLSPKYDPLGHIMVGAFIWMFLVGFTVLYVGEMAQIPGWWLRSGSRGPRNFLRRFQIKPMWVPTIVSLALLCTTLWWGWNSVQPAGSGDPDVTGAVVSGLEIDDKGQVTGAITSGVFGETSIEDGLDAEEMLSGLEMTEVIAVNTDGVLLTNVAMRGVGVKNVATVEGVIVEGNITGGELVSSVTPPLEGFRNALIWSVVFGLAVVLFLGLVIKEWSLTLAIPMVALAWLVVMSGTAIGGGVDGPVRIVGIQIALPGVWPLWLILEFVAGVIIILLYGLLLRTKVAGQVIRNPLWASVGAGFVFAFGLGSIARADDLWAWVLAVSFAPVVMYLIALYWLQIKSGHDRPEAGSMRNGTTMIMAAIGWMTMLTAVSSGAIWVARIAGTATTSPGPLGEPVAANIIRYPAEAGWVAFAALSGIVAALLFGIVRVIMLYFARWKRTEKFICKDYDDEYYPEGEDTVPEFGYDIGDREACANDHAASRLDFAKRARSARLVANITDDVDWIITGAMATALVVLLATSVARAFDKLPEGQLSVVIGFAAWVIGFVVVGAFWAVRTARDNLPLRQSFGMLWDVMAFFPRRFHPLAPPCYAEQAVIDIRDRLIWLNKERAGTIVLAHSEGTLLTCAAMLSLLPDDDGRSKKVAVGSATTGNHPPASGDELDNVAWVTYGCMLNRLFGRAWPNQLRATDMWRLKAELEKQTPETPETLKGFPGPLDGGLPRWMNFGRYTDYLGGRVFSPLQKRPTKADGWSEGVADERCDDVFFKDPVRRWRLKGQVGFARMWRHSFNYESDEEDQRFREYVWNMARVFGGTLDEESVSASADPDHTCTAHLGNEE